MGVHPACFFIDWAARVATPKRNRPENTPPYLAASHLSSRTNWRALGNFRIGVAVEGVTLEDGDLPLTLCIADEPDDLSRKLNEVREESRQKSHDNDLYWAFALTPEIDGLFAQTFASRKMVEKYDQMRRRARSTPTRRPASRTRRTLS